MSSTDLAPGVVAWASLEPVRGREQGGDRPVLVVASMGYLKAANTLVIVIPITTVDRGWPNHVRLGGNLTLERPSWAMAEQPRTISRERIRSTAGMVSGDSLAEVRQWLAAFLDLRV